MKIRLFSPLMAAGTMLQSLLSSSWPFLAGMWTALSWSGDKGQLGHLFWYSWPCAIHGGLQRELWQGRGSSWPQSPGSSVVAGGPAAPPTRAAMWGMEVPGRTDGPVLATTWHGLGPFRRGTHVPGGVTSPHWRPLYSGSPQLYICLCYYFSC